MSFTIEHAEGFTFREVEGWPVESHRWDREDIDGGWTSSLVYVGGRLVFDDYMSRALFGEKPPRLGRYTGTVLIEVGQQRCTGDQYDRADARIAQAQNFQRLLEAFEQYI